LAPSSLAFLAWLSPFSPWCDQDSTWSNQFLYLKLIFCMWLSHRPNDKSTTHLWNVDLLKWNCMVLYLIRLSFIFIHATVRTWNLTQINLMRYMELEMQFMHMNT
jgi:hypothetical protein